MSKTLIEMEPKNQLQVELDMTFLSLPHFFVMTKQNLDYTLVYMNLALHLGSYEETILF